MNLLAGFVAYTLWRGLCSHDGEVRIMSAEMSAACSRSWRLEPQRGVAFPYQFYFGIFAFSG
jgi:hypothetical protein